MVSSANPPSPKQNALMNIPLNGHAVGIIFKEPMRRAIVTIRNERQVFEGTVKRGYQGDMDDVFTSADTKAQAVYLKSLRQCFPDIQSSQRKAPPPSARPAPPISPSIVGVGCPTR